jgi:hypothetical protein
MDSRDLWCELNIAFCIQLAVLLLNMLVARFIEEISVSEMEVWQQSKSYFTNTKYICF